MKKLWIVIFSVFLVGSGDVDPTVYEGIDLIKKVITKYNGTEALKMRVKKKVELSLLEDTRESEGLLYFSKGLMRLEVKKPEKSIIVLNDKAVWLETRVDGFDGMTIHVTKIESKDLKKRSKAPLVLLLTETSAWDNFKIVNTKTFPKSRTMVLKPRKAGEYPELSKVRISVNTDTNELWSISYEDEIENVVTYEFQRPNFDATVSQKKFNYKPPKGAKVVTY